MTSGSPYGFRIVGDLSERRRLVDAGRALAGYCACADGSQVEREAYLSAFDFPGEFKAWMDAYGTPKGYAGSCRASYLWFDIDEADDLDAAHRAARRLAGALLHRYRSLDEGDLLTFFSGSKGFHVGLPLAWGPSPSPTFNLTARRMAGCRAEEAGVKIDGGVYDKVRAFRAPNSRHPKTGLHKRRLSLDELMGLSLARIRDLAREPLPFDLPAPGTADPTAAADWARDEAGARQEAEGKARRHTDGKASGPTINRATFDFIRDGAGVGDRHRTLFSAAANLAEFDSVAALAHALLTEAGRDIGLSPSDVRRQIDCGLSHARAPQTRTPEDHAP